MADRLKAIINCYNACKRDGINFHIIYKIPFVLEDYLIPNKIEWVANMSDLNYVVRKTHFFVEEGQGCLKHLERKYEYHCFNYKGDALPNDLLILVTNSMSYSMNYLNHVQNWKEC